MLYSVASSHAHMGLAQDQHWAVNAINNGQIMRNALVIEEMTDPKPSLQNLVVVHT